MYPETTVTFEGHKWAVWATDREHLGFSCGSNAGGREDDSLLALMVNNVEYRVRFNAVPDPKNGMIALQGEVRGSGARAWMYYGRTVYITRTDYAYAPGKTGEPTESAERKIIELAHRLISAFLGTEEGEALLAAGHRYDTIDKLRSTREALKEATEAREAALFDYLDAEAEAMRIGNVPMEYFA